jgi:hypothetical protein
MFVMLERFVALEAIMRRIVLTLSLLLISFTVLAQTRQTPASPPPQTPRQALLEMFFGTSPNHLEKHLPEIAKKAFRQLDTPGSQGFLAPVSMILAEVRGTGSTFQTFDTGPVLLLTEEPQTQRKFEIAVEQDNLVGEENQIDLSFHMYRQGRQETIPVIPRLTFLMKTEAGIWRLNEIALSVRMPLADPDFMKGLVKDLKKQQQGSNQAMANSSLGRIISAESKFHEEHSERGYTCSLAELAQLGPEENPESRGLAGVDGELASGKKNGYIFVLTGCDRLHYKVAAEPASAAAGQHAFCADESGEIKFASDGKATTCLSRGKSMSEMQMSTD